MRDFITHLSQVTYPTVSSLILALCLVGSADGMKPKLLDAYISEFEKHMYFISHHMVEEQLIEQTT